MDASCPEDKSLAFHWSMHGNDLAPAVVNDLISSPVSPNAQLLSNVLTLCFVHAVP